MTLPANLARLHGYEEQLRHEALSTISANGELRLHVTLVEAAMDLADLYRQFETRDEDLRVTQLLGMRGFNAFSASLKLALSGYGQNAALIQRDILETVFLLDLFGSHRHLIARWRGSDKQARIKEFSPLKVREMLDARDGFTTKKRFQMYEMFSELAGHPTMHSSLMMQPQKGGDVFMGPFIESTTLDAVLSEMGRLALQFGEHIEVFSPPDWKRSFAARQNFSITKQNWMQLYRSKSGARSSAQIK